MNNIVFYLSLAVFCIVQQVSAWAVLGTNCWTCSKSSSHENCLSTGRAVKCRFNEYCHIEWRIENGQYNLNKGCKGRDACTALEMQNPPQCHPGVNPSVCRYCCKTNECNKKMLLPFPGEGLVQGNCKGGMTKTPVSMKPTEQCTMHIPSECVAKGTVVFKVDKLPFEDRQLRLKLRNETLKSGKCLRNPMVETVAVYDDGDSFTMLTRVQYRYANGLPTGAKFAHLVGDENIMKYVNKYNENNIYI